MCPTRSRSLRLCADRTISLPFMCRTLFKEFNTCLSQQYARSSSLTPRTDVSPHVCLRVPSLSTSDEEIDRRVAEYYAARPAAAETAKARPSDLLVAPNGAR